MRQVYLIILLFIFFPLACTTVEVQMKYNGLRRYRPRRIGINLRESALSRIQSKFAKTKFVNISRAYAPYARMTWKRPYSTRIARRYGSTRRWLFRVVFPRLMRRYRLDAIFYITFASQQRTTTRYITNTGSYKTRYTYRCFYCYLINRWGGVIVKMRICNDSSNGYGVARNAFFNNLTDYLK